MFFFCRNCGSYALTFYDFPTLLLMLLTRHFNQSLYLSLSKHRYEVYSSVILQNKCEEHRQTAATSII